MQTSETPAQDRIVDLAAMKRSILEQIQAQQAERLENTLKSWEERQKKAEFDAVADNVKATLTIDEEVYAGRNEEVRRANLKLALEDSRAYTEAVSEAASCERQALLHALAAQANTEQIAIATALLGRISSYDPFHGE